MSEIKAKFCGLSSASGHGRPEKLSDLSSPSKRYLAKYKHLYAFFWVKALVWLGSSLSGVRSFPKLARGEAGYQLYKVQNGIEPSDWKAMATVDSGIQEIRIHVRNEYRVIYVWQSSRKPSMCCMPSKKDTEKDEKRHHSPVALGT